MKRIPNNTAGIEFTALLDNIKDLLRQNYKAAHIHRLLKRDGRITMSYGAFCYHMHRKCSDTPAPTKAPAKPLPSTTAGQTAPTRPQRHPIIVKGGPEPFPDPRNIDPKTLI